MFKICTPAILYSVLVSTQIIIDTLKGYYQYAFMKFIIMIIITGLIQLLCKRELTSVAWIIVLIPYIYMVFLMLLLFYLFGFDIISNGLNLKTNEKQKTEPENNSFIYSAGYGNSEYVSNYTFW